MISEARREASRRNGRRSRGPRTPEGKARSSRNALRHGLSQPAMLDPALADRVAALARAIAGPDAVLERLTIACRIACAQVDVWRARRARAHCLAVQPLDAAALARLAATDRYEGRALSRRKRAIRAFDAASALASQQNDAAPASAAELWEIAARRSSASTPADSSGVRQRTAVARGYRYPVPCRLPDPYAAVNKEWRRIMRLFGHTRREDWYDFGEGTSSRDRSRKLKRPNASKAAVPIVCGSSQTNPSWSGHDCIIAPSAPEAGAPIFPGHGQTDPSGCGDICMISPNEPERAAILLRLRAKRSRACVSRRAALLRSARKQAEAHRGRNEHSFAWRGCVRTRSWSNQPEQLSRYSPCCRTNPSRAPPPQLKNSPVCRARFTDAIRDRHAEKGPSDHTGQKLQ